MDHNNVNHWTINLHYHPMVSDMITRDTLAEIKRILDVTDNPELPERHKDKDRNRIINQTVTDLDNIINRHDPEVDNPIKDGVWNRLDKMGCDLSDANYKRGFDDGCAHIQEDYDAGERLDCKDADARIAELEAKLAKAVDGLRECESEIDQYIRNEYPHDHPVQERYRQRDFAANPARTTLAAVAEPHKLKGTDQ